METKSLKQKTARGLLWGGMNNLLQQVLNLLFGIVLARLLQPEDYGMVGMLLVFSFVAGALQDSGFTVALVNRKDISHRDYNAVFWFSLLMGALLYAILFLAAPLIAAFYHQPALTPLARYLFLSFFLGTLSSAHNAKLIRELRVRTASTIQLSALLVAGVAGIVMAMNGMSYWGIATQTVLYSLLVLLGRSLVSGFRPSMAVDLRPIREMFAFSVKILAANIASHINNNILTVLLGRFYSEREVGFYNQAAKWNQMGFYTLQSMMNNVAQPVLRRVEDDGGRLLRVFRKLMRFAAFVSMPAMLGLSLVAPELIELAVTDKWAESARLMQVVCIGGAFVPLQNLMYNLLLSRERSDICLLNTVAMGLVQTVAVLLCRGGGIFLMVWVFVAINMAWLLVWWFFARRETGLRLRHLVLDVAPFFLIAAASVACAAWAGTLVANTLLRLLAKTAVTALLYLGILRLLGATILSESIEQLKGLLNKTPS